MPETMMKLNEEKKEFEWVVPIGWARWYVRTVVKMGGVSPTFLSKDKAYQSTVSITESGIYSQNKEMGLSFIPTKEIEYVHFCVEKDGDEIFILMHIYHDNSLSNSSFALDTTVSVSELKRWFDKHGIATEDRTEEA